MHLRLRRDGPCRSVRPGRRVAEERLAALEMASGEGKAKAVASASIEHQVEAKNFIAILMGGDEVATDGTTVMAPDCIVLIIAAAGAVGTIFRLHFR